MKIGNQIIPKTMQIPLFLSFGCNVIVYHGSRMIIGKREHFNISSRLDELCHGQLVSI